MSGKGSAPRPFTDREQFDANYDAIFGKKEPVQKPDTLAPKEALKELTQLSQELGLYD